MHPLFGLQGPDPPNPAFQLTSIQLPVHKTRLRDRRAEFGQFGRPGLAFAESGPQALRKGTLLEIFGLLGL